MFCLERVWSAPRAVHLGSPAIDCCSPVLRDEGKFPPWFYKVVYSSESGLPAVEAESDRSSLAYAREERYIFVIRWSGFVLLYYVE
ncbi:unnamed protein product [Hapterophycus canaliculatus]